jgi:hypothetical protein
MISYLFWLLGFSLYFGNFACEGPMRSRARILPQIYAPYLRLCLAASNAALI